jgi:hypothetical protein
VTVLDIENAHFLHGFPLRQIVNQSHTGAIVWNKS